MDGEAFELADLQAENERQEKLWSELLEIEARILAVANPTVAGIAVKLRMLAWHMNIEHAECASRDRHTYQRSHGRREGRRQRACGRRAVDGGWGMKLRLAPPVLAIPHCVLCGSTARDARLFVGSEDAQVCDSCIEAGADTIARTLGQSPAGRINALGQLFRPKAHATIRRALTAGAG